MPQSDAPRTPDTAPGAPSGTVATGPDGTRSRTHTWVPPTDYREALGRSGLEMLRLAVEGRHPQPPICSTLGFRLVEADEGRVVFEGEPGEHLYNPMGTVHGGFLATLLDSALGSSVMSMLPAGRAYGTVQLGVNLVRTVHGDTPTLRCEATALHVGRTTATAEGQVRGAADGRLYAHATTTCAVFALAGS